MINLLAAEDTLQTLYHFNVEIAFAIPLVYFAALVVSILIREFMHGWLRVVAAVLFLGSFSALWFVIMLDNNPWQYVFPAVVLLGGASGLSRVLRSILKDIEKL